MFLDLVVVCAEVRSINARNEVSSGDRWVIEPWTSVRLTMSCIGVYEGRTVGVEKLPVMRFGLIQISSKESFKRKTLWVLVGRRIFTSCPFHKLRSSA